MKKQIKEETKLSKVFQFEEGIKEGRKQALEEVEKMIDELKTYTRKIKPFFRGEFPKYITLIEKKELKSKIKQEMEK